jgi:hypothetical protein
MATLPPSAPVLDSSASAAADGQTTNPNSTAVPVTTTNVGASAASDSVSAGDAAEAHFRASLLDTTPASVQQLHQAILQGDATAISKLLETGADANARDGTGRTALKLALSYHQVDAARILLRAGAKLGDGDEVRIFVAVLTRLRYCKGPA